MGMQAQFLIQNPVAKTDIYWRCSNDITIIYLHLLPYVNLKKQSRSEGIPEVNGLDKESKTDIKIKFLQIRFSQLSIIHILYQLQIFS